MVSYNNGEYFYTDSITVPITNLGYDRSFGVFDFMRMENGRILFIEDYLQRFMNSSKFLFGKSPYSKNEITDILKTLIDLNKVNNSTFKLNLTGEIINGEMKPHLVILNRPYEAYPKEKFEKGSRLIAEEYVRENSQYKTLNYLVSFKNYNRLQKADAIDVLFHTEDKISEASRSNVFMIKDKKIYTTDNDLLHGITRKVVLRTFKNNLKVEIKPIKYSEILKADEVFITSTLKKVLPIVRIEHKVIGNGRVGEVTKLAMARFKEICDNY